MKLKLNEIVDEKIFVQQLISIITLHKHFSISI